MLWDILIIVTKRNSIQQKKFNKLLRECKPKQDPEKIVFNFSNVTLTEAEKSLVEVSRQEDHFVTNVYRKSAFSGVYMHFESFLPTIYKFWYDIYFALSLFQNLFYMEKIS